MYKLLAILALLAIAYAHPVAEQENVTEQEAILDEIPAAEKDKAEEPEKPIPSNGEQNPATVEEEDENEREIEAAIDEFLKYLDTIDAEEVTDEVFLEALVKLFETLDKVLTIVDNIPDEEDQNDERVSIEDFIKTTTTTSKPLSEGDDNNENVTKDTPIACRLEKGQPGVCVPYRLCDVASRNEMVNAISFDMDRDSCPSATEVCCSLVRV